MPEGEHERVLTRLVAALPHRLLYLGPDDHAELPDFLANLAATLDRRRADRQAGRLPIFLVIHGLMRLPVLRPSRTAGTFGSARSAAAEAPPTSEVFRTILRDGPEVGIHTVATCDTLPNLRRVLESTWEELFALRVGLQMDEDTSNALLHSRAAARLGLSRAILFDDHRSTSETFRPFAIPPADWMGSLREQLESREQTASPTT